MLDSNFTQEHIFIVGNGSLFDEGMTRLLTNESNLVVSRAIYSDEVALLNIIKRDCPDVILVCESGSLDAVRILDLVSSLPIVLGLQIVVVRLNTSVIDVYARPSFAAGKISFRLQRIVNSTGDDLLNAVRGKYDS